MKTWKVDLLQGSIAKGLVLFALPLLLSNIFQQFYNTIDTVIVGNTLGDKSLAAIGASMAIFQLIIGFSQGFGNGMAIVTARSYGSRDPELLKRSVASAIVLGTGVVILVTVVSRIFLWSLLEWIRTPAEIIHEAYAYISIIVTFIGVTFAYNLLAGLYRAVGNSLIPLVFLIFSSLVNVGLDILFVVYWHWGIEGAAIATVVAQGISVLLSILYIRAKLPMLIPRKEHFKPDIAIYKEMLGQGSSMAVMYSLVFIGTLVLQYAINDMGYLIIAGHTTARRLNALFIMPIATMGNAVSTFVSQNKGADHPQRIKAGVKYGARLVLGWSFLMIFLVYLTGGMLVQLISGSTEPLVIETGRRYLLWNAPFYTVVGLLFLFRFTLQGLGQKIVPLVSSLIEMGLKILFALVVIPQVGYFGVIICEPVIWVLMALQLGYAYRKNTYLFPAKAQAE